MSMIFEAELEGKFGKKRKKWAESLLSGLKAQADKGNICVDKDGAAFWKQSGNYLDADVCQTLKRAGYEFDPEATVSARVIQLQKVKEIQAYRKVLGRYVSFDEIENMRKLFGAGMNVVNTLTGAQIQL